MKIEKKHAGICFGILGGFAGLYGLFILGLFVLLHGDDRFSVAKLLFVLAPFTLSVVWGWAAYSLLRKTQKGSVIAVVAWLLAAALSVCVVVDCIKLEVTGVHSPEMLLAVIVFVVPECVITLHFIQYWRETAT